MFISPRKPKLEELISYIGAADNELVISSSFVQHLIALYQLVLANRYQ